MGIGRLGRRLLAAAAFVVTAVGLASPALARSYGGPGGTSERPLALPAGTYHVPAYRTGPAWPRLVVCRPNAQALSGVAARLRRECAYHDIQAAVDAVRQRGTTIYVLPGTYRETPAKPSGACRRLPADRPLTYDEQRACPHLRNLIGVFGQSDLQIEGLGNVVIAGDKQVGIRADRANGLYLRNLALRGFDEDGVDVVETDGFVLDHITALNNDAHGIAVNAADHGVIADCTAAGNRDAGIATTSAADRRGARLSIEIRGCRSYGNVVGYAGTAGDSVYVHDNEFAGNSTGAVLDSAVAVPGMPQNHAMFVANQIHGNNADFYVNCGDACPRRAVPVGTGLLLAGGDENTYASNFIYDNWRYGVAQHWVPARRRGVSDPARQRDTSHGNRYLGNLMGITPSGVREPNGLDFWWDEQGDRNCWQNNASSWGRPRSDPAALPACDHPSSAGPYEQQGNPAKTATVTACAAYKGDGRPPPGCPWLAPPARPQS